MTTYYHYYKSPVGKLLLVGDGLNLNALGFPYGKMKRKSEVAWIKDGSTFKNTVDQLLESENKEEIAKKCFEFLKTRSELDLIGFENLDIFAH